MRIRRFNESADKEIDAEYVRHCFADLIDSGAATIEERNTGSYGKFAAIRIDLKETKRGDIFTGIISFLIISDKKWLLKDIISLGKHNHLYESNNRVYQEVKLALERLSEEYPNYKITAHNFVDSYCEYISIRLLA